MITELSSLQSNLLLICTDNWWQSHTISAHSSLLKTILKKDCRTPGRSDKLTETYLAVVKWSEGKHISSLQQSKMIKLSWLPARRVEHDLVDLSFMSSSPAGQTGTTYSVGTENLSSQQEWCIPDHSSQPSSSWLLVEVRFEMLLSKCYHIPLWGGHRHIICHLSMTLLIARCIL